jgi:NADH-quinone oxidoreductase subunit L
MPNAFGLGNAFETWLEPVLSQGERVSLVAGAAEGTGLEFALMGVSVAVAIAGIMLATQYYRRRTTLAKQEAELGAVYRLAHNKFYVDELYDKTIIQPIYNVSNGFLYKIIDVRVIDGFVNGLAHITEIGSGTIRRIQTGIVQNYAVMIVIGLFVLVGYLVMF